MELNSYELRFWLDCGDFVDCEIDATSPERAIRFAAQAEGIALSEIESVSFGDGQEFCSVSGRLVSLNALMAH